MSTSTSELEKTIIEPSNLINNFKVIDEAMIRRNAYYMQYGENYTA